MSKSSKKSHRGKENFRKAAPRSGSWESYHLLPASVRAVFEVMHPPEKDKKPRQPLDTLDPNG